LAVRETAFSSPIQLAKTATSWIRQHPLNAAPSDLRPACRACEDISARARTSKLFTTNLFPTQPLSCYPQRNQGLWLAPADRCGICLFDNVIHWRRLAM